jgi:FlaA1/EpsC-like NDP-sugar epimerase
MNRLSQWLLEYRRPVVVAAHVLLWVAAYVGAFLLRFDFAVPAPFDAPVYVWWAVPLVVLRIGAFSWFGLFHGMWRYTGQKDLEDLLKGTFASTLLFALGELALGPRPFPRSVFMAEFLLAVAFTAGLRLSVRAFAGTARRIGPLPRAALEVSAPGTCAGC